MSKYGENRSKPVSLRLSPEELAWIKDQAEVEGIGVSEFLRRRALKRAAEARGAPWSGRWSWFSIHPKKVASNQPETWEEIPWGHVYFDDEGLDFLAKLAGAAWHSCGYCYGTGYRDYKGASDSPKPGDCPECDGWGVVQMREWQQRQQQRTA